VAEQRASRKPEVRRSLAEGLVCCPQFRMEESEALAFGQAVHTFAAAYTRHLQAAGLDSDLAMVTALSSDAWARTLGLRQERWDEFMELCDLFARSHAIRVETILTVEQPLIRDVGFAIVNCTPDRVDRLDDGDPDDDPTWLGITDYKTEEGEMDHAFQERWYVHQAFQEWPAVRWIDFAFDFLRHPCEPEVRRWVRGETDIWWETQMQALRLRLLAPDAPPRGGPACDSCALRRDCGAALTRAAAIPRSDEEADVLLEEHHRMHAGAALRWDALEAYYRGRPERVVQGEEVGWLLTRRPSWFWTARPSAVAAWALRRRLDWRAFVHVTARPLLNRGLQEEATAAGLGELRFKPREFKTRRAEPERRRRRRDERAAE
jgi:hypothetical protein